MTAPLEPELGLRVIKDFCTVLKIAFVHKPLIAQVAMIGDRSGVDGDEGAGHHVAALLIDRRGQSDLLTFREVLVANSPSTRA